MRRLSRTAGFPVAIACVVCGLAARSACGQQTAQSPAPQIVVSGSAEVLIPPSTGSFSIGVLTSAQTAAAAAEENARISKAVLEGLGRAGVKSDEITGSRLGVRPQWEYDEKGRHPKRSAFEATNTIQIATENLSKVGMFVDAALSAGATDASDIAFSAKDANEARRRALSQAVAAARADAEVMARAGGGALGELLLLSTERTNEVPGVELSEMAVAGARRTRETINTDVIPSQIKVSARVIARWRFVVAPTQK
jgi:uncharacterized protein